MKSCVLTILIAFLKNEIYPTVIPFHCRWFPVTRKSLKWSLSLSSETRYILSASFSAATEDDPVANPKFGTMATLPLDTLQKIIQLARYRTGPTQWQRNNIYSKILKQPSKVYRETTSISPKEGTIATISEWWAYDCLWRWAYQSLPHEPPEYPYK